MLRVVGVILGITTVGALPAPHAAAAPPAPTRRCDRIAHVGDSLTARMAPLLPGAYARYGWHDPVIDAYGGRGVARRMYAGVTGLEAAANILASGFAGCWVLALGTNDTAHVADDDATQDVQHERRRQLIESMMDLVGDAPVMWVGVFLVADDDAYSAAAAADWNLALAEELATHPNMRVFDWASIAAEHHAWMSTDRIHDTALGSIARARLVTEAAADTFASFDVGYGIDTSGAQVASLAPAPPAPPPTFSPNAGAPAVRRALALRN